MDWSSPDTLTATRSVGSPPQLDKIGIHGPPNLQHEVEWSQAKDKIRQRHGALVLRSLTPCKGLLRLLLWVRYKRIIRARSMSRTALYATARTSTRNQRWTSSRISLCALAATGRRSTGLTWSWLGGRVTHAGSGKICSGDCRLGLVRISFVWWVAPMLIALRELGKLHCAKSDDESVGGGTDARLRSVGYSATVQGAT